jgi:hypothetical protein
MTLHNTRGVLFVHSSPRALCPHLEWAVGKALGSAVNFSWVAQPVLPGTLRAEYEWEGPVGSGATIASALRGWEHLRFEVTEEASAGTDGGRWMHTPDLGVFYAQMDALGNTVVSEDRIVYALEVASGDPGEINRELRLALGRAWDEELEPFRHAGDATPVVWFHRVG